MKKLSGLLLMSALGFAGNGFANGFGHTQELSVNGEALTVANTSARVLANNDRTELFLVDDIFDGLAANKQPGYKVMTMSRTSSLLSEARKTDDGGWRDDRMIHRGIKVLIGIPVTDGKMDLSKAAVLSSAVISDKSNPEFNKEKDIVRPRGKKIVKKDSQISDVKFSLTDLQLPNMQSGEQSGGGIKYSIDYTVNGSEKIHADVNSTFTIFYTATPEKNRGFSAEERFIAAEK